MNFEVDKRIISAPLFKTTVMTDVLKQIKSMQGTSNMPFPTGIKTAAQLRTVVYLLVTHAAENTTLQTYVRKKIRGMKVQEMSLSVLNRLCPELEDDYTNLFRSKTKGVQALYNILQAWEMMESDPMIEMSYYSMFIVAVTKARMVLKTADMESDPLVDSLLRKADSLLRVN